jgi:penicillin amidase
MMADVEGETADQRAALALLRSWDGDEGPESAPAALFEVWIARHLRQTATAVLAPKAARAALNAFPTAVVTVLAANDPLLGPDPRATRRLIVNTSLGEAFEETRSLLGPDPTRWRWGTLHHATFIEGASALAPEARRSQFAVGPLEVGGSASTPMATSYRGGDFAVAAGASVRMVLDVGAWDNSVVVNAPGQSGDPSSPHFRDLFPLWAGGSYAPLLFSEAAVAAETERVIALTPAP